MGEMPPGFRFYPTEEELVSFYLHDKLQGGNEKRLRDFNLVIPTLQIYDLDPWDLPEHSGKLCRGDMEQWFFFTPRQETEARGGRPTRTTASGYWKATGSPSYVYSSDNRVIGVKKTMVFYKGRAPTGRKTKWKLHEFRAIEEETTTPFGCAVPKLRHEMSLCRVYVVAGGFGAFDRRPLGAETSKRESQDIQEHGGVTPSQANQVAGRSSSTESAYSGEDHFEFTETNLGMISQEPLWDWEQLNWP